MPDLEPTPDHPPDNPDVRFEPSDASLKPIVAMGVGIILLGLFAHVACLWVFDALKAIEAEDDKDRRLSPLAAKERPELKRELDNIPAPRLQVDHKEPGKAPQPWLQVDETVDLHELRRAEDSRLNSYGWTGVKKDTVHIPIDAAMRLLLDPDIAKSRGIRVDKGDKQ